MFSHSHSHQCVGPCVYARMHVIVMGTIRVITLVSIDLNDELVNLHVLHFMQNGCFVSLIIDLF